MITIEGNGNGYRDPFPSDLGSVVAYRTYLKPQEGPDGTTTMQTWEENAARNADFLAKLGELTPAQRDAIYRHQCELTVTPPGRVLWAAVESWVNKDGYSNYLGLFNCVGIQPTSWKWFGYNFLLLMMGCGVGAVIEEEVIAQLPHINKNLPVVTVSSLPGDHAYRPEHTTYTLEKGVLTIYVGDSKEGWVDSYVALLVTCSDPLMEGLSYINIELGGVRPNGSPIKGFGGTANPVALPPLYMRVMEVLEGAAGRGITSYEACLLLNWAAVTTVAGNIRRSARWDGYTYRSPSMTGAKDNLWSQDPVTGEWAIDPKKDALRMVNISAITHVKPTMEECHEFVQKQYDTGEGALYYAPAALTRTNVDLLPTHAEQQAFEHAYTTLGKETGRAYLRAKIYDGGAMDVGAVERELDHRMMRYGANPCVEVLGRNFVCSLSQVDLSRFDTASPTLWDDINTALDTAALIVCALLKKGFAIPELQESREIDPIVAVTLNGVFDFMVNLLGEPWLRWWMAGCPEYWRDPLGKLDNYIDIAYSGYHSQEFIEDTKYILNSFRDKVRDTVTAYCTQHNLPIPNRYTAMQPSGSKSCLTGGTPACYTPKASYWIRRVTIRRDHPVALAAIDWGYNVVPSTSCKDSDGNLLKDPYDEAVNEWLIEMPDKCMWSSRVKGDYDVAHAPITSQWYLTMACQTHFVTHNTSVTFELDKDEVPVLATLIHDEIRDGGNYVSGAIFARDYSVMPRMPYEPITKEDYGYMMQGVMERRASLCSDGMTFKGLVEYYHNLDRGAEMGPTVGCDGDSCTIALPALNLVAEVEPHTM